MQKNLNANLGQIISVVHKTINCVDSTLLDHGERVAYILFNLLKQDGNYSEDELTKLCIIGTFHDIGAYKVSEQDQLVTIDVIAPYEHAVYGSLFIKYFSPLSDLFHIILIHHFDERHFKKINPKLITREGLLLSFADYIDRLYFSNVTLTREVIEKRGKGYSKEYIDLFCSANEKFDFINKLKDDSYKDELHQFFKQKSVTREEIIDYSKMLAYSIDFRSEATVKHTITVEAISYQIGKLCGLNDDDLIKIQVAATLHDIGKVNIPVELLEKPGKLTPEEFEIIKSHALIGYNILSDLGLDDIRDIATLHHEKLDGSGYPFGLKGDELSKEVRIIAIADIVSALVGARSYKEGFDKDKIINILQEMVRYNKIDAEITTLFIENYDYLMSEAKAQYSALMDIYLNLSNEYKAILKEFTH